MNTGMMHKLQTAFTFPTCLKLHRYMARGKRDAAEEEAQPPPIYQLQAVLSHVGDAGGGHYVAYVRPRGGKQWYEFDDTRVTPVSEDVAVRQQYGGAHSTRGGGLLGWGQKPNAYMLVYVRRDFAEKPLRSDADVAAAREAFEPSGELLPPRVRESFERALRGEPPRGRKAKSRRSAAVKMAAAEQAAAAAASAAAAAAQEDGIADEEMEDFFG